MNGRLRVSLSLAYAALVVAALLLVAVFGADASTRFTAPDLSKPIVVRNDGRLRQGDVTVGRFLPSSTQADLATASIAVPVTVDQEPLTARITFILPSGLNSTQVNLQPISIQGSINLQSDYSSPTALTATLPGLVADAHTQLGLTAPVGNFSFPPFQRLQVWLQQVALWFWFGLIVFLLALGGSSYLASAPWRRPKGAIDQALIKGIAPAEAAIFTHSSLHPSDLAALLFDLAQRGYLQFVDKPSQREVLLFRATQGQGALRTYEEWLLNLLAPKAGQPQSIRQALLSLDRGVFSQAVGAVYVEGYRVFSEKGYVTTNPRLLHLRWKTVGIIIQLLGVLTSVVAYLAASTLTYLPLAGAAAYISGLIVYYAAYRILPLTPAGVAAYGSLQGLRAYLSQKAPVTDLESREGALLYRLMPYALAFGVEKQWGERFRSGRCLIPSWFSTEREVYDADVFMAAVARVTDTLAHAVAKFKDPNVD